MTNDVLYAYTHTDRIVAGGSVAGSCGIMLAAELVGGMIYSAKYCIFIVGALTHRRYFPVSLLLIPLH